jgi:hypothetical protein
VGEFRDELRDAGWVGGDPHRNPEAYLARGGRTTAMNLLTPLLIVHGEVDPRVPYEQATAYAAALAHHGRQDRLRLQSFPGVGNPSHYSGMTTEMNALRAELIATHHRQHDTTPQLPARGRFVVAGYLRTRQFEIRLERVGHVALLSYDLSQNEFRLRAPSSSRAVVTVGDDSRLVPCEPLTLAAFCDEIGVPDPRDYPLP